MTPGDKLAPRRLPCASCPYRQDVPSGVWAAGEYDKLLSFDGTTAEQAMKGAFGVFMCHQRDDRLCAGWVGCHDMRHNLAIRMPGASVDRDACLAYESPVPLFGSGAEAAEHGKREIKSPSPEAVGTIEKVMRIRGVRVQQQGEDHVKEDH